MNFTQQDESWMKQALQLAQKAYDEDEVPIGALIVDQNNNLIAQGYNQKEQQQNPCMHAEVIAIQEASKHLKNWRLLGCKMYVTLEPCLMCAGAIYQARLSQVTYSCADPKAGALNSLYEIQNDQRLNHQFEVASGLLAEESSELLKVFFRGKRK